MKTDEDPDADRLSNSNKVKNNVSMTDEQANAMVRDKLNRALKRFGPKLTAYYKRKCIYAERGTTRYSARCDICSKFEIVSFTIGKKIELCSEKHEIRITDRNGVNVYKMDDETWNLAYRVKPILNEKYLKRARIKSDWYDILVTMGFALWIVAGVTVTVLMCAKHIEKEFEEQQQEKVIQFKKDVDSVNMAKTIYYYDNVDSIVK